MVKLQKERGEMPNIAAALGMLLQEVSQYDYETMPYNF